MCLCECMCVWCGVYAMCVFVCMCVSERIDVRIDLECILRMDCMCM